MGPSNERLATELPAWEDLLRRLQLAVGSDGEPDAVRAAATRTEADLHARHAWPERLVAASAHLGLHAVVMRGTVRQLVDAVSLEHPVVTYDADGRWLLLVDRGARSAEVVKENGETGWWRLGDLSIAVDPDGEGQVTFVAIEPPGLFHGVATRYDGGEPPLPTSPWARLRALVRRERQDVLVTVVYAIGVGLLTLATPIAVQALVNTVAFGTLLQPLVVLTLLLLGGLSLAGVLRALQAFVVEILQRRLFVRLVNDLSHRLPRVELSAFDRAHGPELVNRFFDIFTIQKTASSLLLGGLEIVLSAMVGMLVLAFYHPLLLAFDVLLIAVVVAILFGLGRGATATAVKESKAKYEVASWLEEVARHPAAFKLAGGPSLARGRADDLAARYLVDRKKHFRIVFRQLVGALALQAFASAGILGIGGWLVIARQLTLGQLVAAELIVTMVVASFAKVGKHLETTYDLLAALDKVGQLIDLPLERSDRTTSRPATVTPGGARLRVSGLCFGYEEDQELLVDVGFELAAGDRAVLTGTSGAGRSALVDVLLGLRRHRAGLVEIDGVDVDDLDREALRERTALVRGGEVVVGTVFDNVAFGRRALDRRAVRDALRAVGLLDDISRLPEGLDTRVTPDGSPLSRGQARRLMLARAIAGRPALLLIDGALDGFDEETREPLLATVFAEDAPWTLLAVTDDPHVRRRCHRALALRDGAVVEEAEGGQG